MQLNSKRTRVAVVGALTLVLGGAGVTYANATSTTSTTITACSLTGIGQLRMVDSAKECKKGERVVVWNVTGPAGPVGPKGATGASGAKGDTGPKGATGTTGARPCPWSWCVKAAPSDPVFGL
jgi:hypothetical protein